jgi:hypothetical protein
MRDARCELPDRLQLLGLAQRLLGPLPLRHLGGELGIGLGEAVRALGDQPLELVGEVAVPRLAGGQRLQRVMHLVLAAARPQGGLNGADQRRRADRTVEQGEVADALQPVALGAAMLGRAAAVEQQNEGKIRPGGLLLDPADERRDAVLQGFLGDETGAGALLQSLDQGAQIRTDDARQAGTREDGLCQRPVAAGGCENQQAGAERGVARMRHRPASCVAGARRPDRSARRS